MGKHQSLSYHPRLLGSSEAATYLGVSEGTLRVLNIPRRLLRGRKLFDRVDLDRYASDLPYEHETRNTCDEAFN